MRRLIRGSLLLVNIIAFIAIIGAYLSTHFSPNKVPYLYFLGLGYSYLLVANLLFIVVWFFVKKRFALISLISIILGFNHLSNYFAFSFGTRSLENPIKICSYNVHVFNVYSTETRIEQRDECFNFLTDLNASIYCFQEFYTQEQPSDFETKLILQKKLKTPHIHEGYTHKLSNERYFGLVTFSKFPILKKGEIVFENDANNFCIYSDLLVGNDTIRVYNAHLGSIRFQDDDYKVFGSKNGPKNYLKAEAGQKILTRLKYAFEKRAVQAEKVANHMVESPYKTILCMDLNDTPVSYAYKRFGGDFDDAFLTSGWGTGETYRGKMPSNRIDYIFTSEGVETKDFQIHQVEFSDHKPISCEIGSSSK